MNRIEQYKILSVVIIAVSIYVLFTEVAGRIEETMQQYTAMREKEKSFLSPEDFIMRKRELQAEKLGLTMSAKKNIVVAQQNQGGLFEYLNTNANIHHITVRTIAPSEGKTSGSAKIITFTMNVAGRFHDASTFINSIETGSLPIAIQKVSYHSEPIGNSMLDITIEGRARLFTGTK